MICFTNDTPLRRAGEYEALLQKMFDHIHSMSSELLAYDESKIQEFEEEFLTIRNPEKVKRPEEWPDYTETVEEEAERLILPTADDRTFEGYDGQS